MHYHYVNTSAKLLGVLAAGIVAASLYAGPRTDSQIDPMSQNPAPAMPSIQVTGSGKATVDPDMATVNVGVQFQAPTAKAAQEQVNRTATAIRDAVIRVVGDRKFLQTSNVSIFPQYGANSKITGYAASNTILVRVEDIARVGDVVDAASNAGANQINGISFGMKNSDAAHSDALRDAVADAKRKAEAIATALGVRITGPIRVTEGGGGPVMPVMGRSTFMKAESAPVEPGEIDVNATVSIEYGFSG